MRIDYELIRNILLEIEAVTDGHTNFAINDFCREKFPDNPAADYHIKYLRDAGFLEAGNGYFVDILPAGREYLESIRNKSVWNCMKKQASNLESVPISIMAEIAKSATLRLLNLD